MQEKSEQPSALTISAHPHVVDYFTQALDHATIDYLIDTVMYLSIGSDEADMLTAKDRSDILFMAKNIRTIMHSMAD